MTPQNKPYSFTMNYGYSNAPNKGNQKLNVVENVKRFSVNKKTEGCCKAEDGCPGQEYPSSLVIGSLKKKRLHKVHQLIQTNRKNNNGCRICKGIGTK